MDFLVDSPEVREAMTTALVALLLFIAGLLGVGIKKLSAVDKATKSTKRQVTNDHSTNLRDDLSTAISKVEKVAEISSNNSKEILEIKDALNDHMKNQNSEFRHVKYIMGELHDQIDRESKDRQLAASRYETEHNRLWKAIEDVKT